MVASFTAAQIFFHLILKIGLILPISQPRLAWSKLKCQYPYNSPDYKKAYAKLQNASYPDLETLRAEFDEYDDGSIPVIHYQHKGEWYAKVGLTGAPQKLNMRGFNSTVENGECRSALEVICVSGRMKRCPKPSAKEISCLGKVVSSFLGFRLLIEVRNIALVIESIFQSGLNVIVHLLTLW